MLIYVNYCIRLNATRISRKCEMRLLPTTVSNLAFFTFNSIKNAQ